MGKFRFSRIIKKTRELFGVVAKAGGMATNLTAHNYYTETNAFLDRVKTIGTFGAAPVDSNGYPTAYASGQTSLSSLLALEPYRAGVPNRWVLTHNGTGSIDFDLGSGRGAAVSGLGTQRFVFDWTNGGVQAIIRFNSMTVWPTQMSLLRLDQEALLASGEIFTPAYIDDHKNWSVLRFMDWNSTNNNPETDFTARRKTTEISWAQNAAGKAVPLEVQIALCNKTGCDMWYNVPMHYTQASRIAAFTLIKSLLDPSLRLHVELSNEVWNFGFEQTGYAYAQGQLTTVAGAQGNENTFYGQMAADTMQDAIGVFAGARNRLVTHLGTQMVNRAVYNTVELGFQSRGFEVVELIDEVNGTWYLDGGWQGNAPKGTATTQKTKILDTATLWQTDPTTALNTFFAQMRTGGTTGFTTNGVTLASHKADVDAWVALAATKAWEFGFYEGQLYHLYLDTNFTDPSETSLILPFFQAALDDPRTGAMITEVLEYARAKVRGTFTIFTDLGVFSKFGPWGSRASVYTAESTRSAAYKAFQSSPTVSAPAYDPLTISYPAGTPIVSDTMVTKPTARGGKLPRTFSIASGSLPAGRSLVNGKFTGAFTTAGTYNYTIRVTDARGVYTDLPVAQTVTELPTGAYTYLASGGNTVSGSVQTFSVDIGAAHSDRYILLMATVANGNPVPLSVTVNGVALSLLGSAGASGASQVAAYGGIVATGSGAVNAVVTWTSASFQYKAMALWSLAGLTSTTPKLVQATTAVNTGSETVSVTNGDLVFFGGAAIGGTSPATYVNTSTPAPTGARSEPSSGKIMMADWAITASATMTVRYVGAGNSNRLILVFA